MSLYRMLRFTAIVAVLRRYRVRFARMLFCVAFAMTTAWLYGDVASYLDSRHPQWTGWALVLKTLVVYAALFAVFWDLIQMLKGDDGVAREAEERQPARRATAETVRPLDALAEKPRLASRRDEILRDN